MIFTAFYQLLPFLITLANKCLYLINLTSELYCVKLTFDSYLVKFNLGTILNKLNYRYQVNKDTVIPGWSLFFDFDLYFKYPSICQICPTYVENERYADKHLSLDKSCKILKLIEFFSLKQYSHSMPSCL